MKIIACIALVTALVAFAHADVAHLSRTYLPASSRTVQLTSSGYTSGSNIVTSGTSGFSGKLVAAPNAQQQAFTSSSFQQAPSSQSTYSSVSSIPSTGFSGKLIAVQRTTTIFHLIIIQQHQSPFTYNAPQLVQRKLLQLLQLNNNPSPQLHSNMHQPLSTVLHILHHLPVLVEN
ncbi:uncharacterized protein LOC119672840 [Teleopsis dalmanni]|uniref:uncharacterized protein LOC119672840 n=1 Tax=Teleopsis dalmanni TaxID=139649 RepID=UPI0018CFDDC4|nr:uncharacterized protein LOC119672840 [Teleopsis dalmanni]